MPEKTFWAAKEDFLCTDMKKYTLEALYEALKEEKTEIVLDEATLKNARAALEKMINL